jgi:hypothetical protein
MSTDLEIVVPCQLTIRFHDWNQLVRTKGYYCEEGQCPATYFDAHPLKLLEEITTRINVAGIEESISQIGYQPDLVRRHVPPRKEVRPWVTDSLYPYAVQIFHTARLSVETRRETLFLVHLESQSEKDICHEMINLHGTYNVVAIHGVAIGHSAAGLAVVDPVRKFEDRGKQYALDRKTKR